MAFNQTIEFEVDAATGNDSNGGGFDGTSGVPGTNYAWGAGQTVIAYTDLATTGTSAIISSVNRPFISADVGNVINITGGTNFTAGRYQIMSVAGGLATVDRNCTSGVGSVGVGNLGGSLVTIQKGINVAFIDAGAVESCTVWIKKGNYTGTLALTTVGSVSPLRFHFRVLGYNISHGDNPSVMSGNQPIYAVGSGAGVNGLNDFSSGGYWIGFITFDGTATSGTRGVVGINVTASYATFFEVKVMNFSSHGFVDVNSQVAKILCESTGNGNMGFFVNDNCYGCWSHKNVGRGIDIEGHGVAGAINCLITNNGSDGLFFGDPFGNMAAIGNTIYGNGGNGIFVGSSSYDLVLGTLFFNNIVAKNGGYGISSAGFIPSNQTKTPNLNYNAFYANTSGAYNNGVVLNTHDVSVSVNPFNSSDADLASETNPDWGLNNTASAGASLRAAGNPGNFPGLSTTTGYKDIGAVQHQDSGGAATYTGFLIV